MWWWIRSGLWISGLQGLLCKCLRFCSIPEQTCMDCMPDITIWDIKPISFKYISVGGGEFILCLTPFFETYELKGYIVEVISDISHFGNVTCWVMLKWSLCWLFVIGSFIWSSILVIIVLIIYWPKAWLLYKVCFCGRDFVEPHIPEMVKTGKMRQGYEG